MVFHAHTDQIATVEGFLSQQECEAYMALSEKIGYEMAKVNSENGQKVVPQVRNNNRAFYTSDETAQLFWTKARPFVPADIGNSSAIGLNERFRFYRYHPGQQFKGHSDENYIRSAREASYVTLMVYLNDNFEGGETTFQDFWITPKQGTALLFLHNLYHAGREVFNGTKYVLRTDVMYRLKTAL